MIISKNDDLGSRFLQLLNENDIPQKVIIDKYKISHKSLDLFFHNRKNKEISEEMRFKIIQAITKEVNDKNNSLNLSKMGSPQAYRLTHLTKLFNGLPEDIQDIVIKTTETLDWYQLNKSRKTFSS